MPGEFPRLLDVVLNREAVVGDIEHRPFASQNRS
jgi:hypothetical protein